MLELDFNPGKDPKAPVAAALVGKGITFDSGGYSMKTSQGMLTMKHDMAVPPSSPARWRWPFCVASTSG
jgi:leucyl aminopeptidase